VKALPRVDYRNEQALKKGGPAKKLVFFTFSLRNGVHRFCEQKRIAITKKL
jgi:hypothetical protein